MVSLSDISSAANNHQVRKDPRIARVFFMLQIQTRIQSPDPRLSPNPHDRSQMGRHHPAAMIGTTLSANV